MFTLSFLAKHSSMLLAMPPHAADGISEKQAEHEEPWGFDLLTDA
jgi:hypothetical protein